MYCTHLHLENWRNFTLVDLSLQRRVFVVGPNASGKSNLLDAFRFLRDVVAPGGGFLWAVNRRSGVSRIRSLAARRNPAIAIRVSIGDEPNTPLWDYELHFSQDNRQRATVVKEQVTRGGQVLLSRPDEHDRRDSQRLSQTYLEQVTANHEFREVAAFFDSIRYLHIVPQLVREPDRSVGRRDDPYGSDFLDQLARTPGRTRDARLRRIRDALRVAVPQLKELEMTRDAVTGAPHLRGKYEHWRPQGAWQTEEQFSDGTLRLLGLLWAVQDGAGPLLLEEPEMSLHPDVVRVIPSMLARTQRRTGRQVVVSTHSTDLLSDEGIGLDEVFLLIPHGEGTGVHAAGDFEDIRDLLAGGVPLAEAVVPRTRPQRVHQLSFFADAG